MNNPWRYCDKEKPPEYTRIEIRDKEYVKYVGYRYKKSYFETIGNYLIKNPYQWRYIPIGSYLWNEILDKIRELQIERGEAVYNDRANE